MKLKSTLYCWQLSLRRFFKIYRGLGHQKIEVNGIAFPSQLSTGSVTPTNHHSATMMRSIVVPLRLTLSHNRSFTACAPFGGLILHLRLVRIACRPAHRVAPHSTPRPTKTARSAIIQSPGDAGAGLRELVPVEPRAWPRNRAHAM